MKQGLIETATCVILSQACAALSSSPDAAWNCSVVWEKANLPPDPYSMIEIDLCAALEGMGKSTHLPATSVSVNFLQWILQSQV